MSRRIDYKLKRRSLVLGAGLVLVIVAAQIITLLDLNKVYLQENRNLARWPATPTTLAGFGKFLSGINSYTQDHFGPRPFLISRLNYLRYKAEISPHKNIIIGKNGWLFVYYADHMALTRGIVKMGAAEREKWVDTFKARTEFAAEHNAKYYMLVVPDKNVVYREYLPNSLYRLADTPEFDDLLAELRAKKIDSIVDLRQDLMLQKPKTMMYPPYDTHWTGYGAYLGYVRLISRISRDFPDIAPYPLDYYVPLAPGSGPRDLANFIGVDSLLNDNFNPQFESPLPKGNQVKTYLSERRNWSAPFVLDTGASSKYTLLLSRDSFGIALLPFLEPHFKRIVVMHYSDGHFREDFIEKYHPDIVLQVTVQSSVRHTMDANWKPEETVR